MRFSESPKRSHGSAGLGHLKKFMGQPLCSPVLTEVEKDEAGGNGEQALEALSRPMTGKSRPKGYVYSLWKKHCPHKERQKVSFHCRLTNHWLFSPWDRQGRKRKGLGMIYSQSWHYLHIQANPRSVAEPSPPEDRKRCSIYCVHRRRKLPCPPGSGWLTTRQDYIWVS